MEHRILSVGWSTHAVKRLKDRLNAEPSDLNDLLMGCTPFALHNSANPGFAVDVPHVCRVILNRDPNPKRVGGWVVITVLDWDQRKGRGSGRRVPTGRAELKRKRTDFTDEDLQWIEQL
jgi:hypothetical protein